MIGKLRCFGAAENPSFEAFWVYSKNRYQSYDLDFITYEDLRKVKKALSKYGFEYNSKYFIRPGCPWIIEFVAPSNCSLK
jgi:hypothetical protein